MGGEEQENKGAGNRCLRFPHAHIALRQSVRGNRFYITPAQADAS